MLATAATIEPASAADAQPKANGKVRLLTFADIDRRTRAYQCAERLLDGLLSDLGGEDHVSVAQRELAQRAAVLGAMLADAEVRWMRAEPVEMNEYLAAINAHRRVLTTLGLERKARDVTDLHSYLRQKAKPE